jgi:hypothetical protein
MRGRNILFSSLLLLLCCTFSLAQTITGSVTGTVTDASGAIVSGATVTATNIATGVSFPTQTNNDGVYTIRFLPIGQYKVAVTATGFDTSTTAPFALEVAQEARIDVKLTVGTVSQNVVVTTAAPILDTQNATTGDTITAETATEVPLQARNFSSLSLLVAGAVTTNPSAQNSVMRSAYNGGYFQNGNREQTNNYTLDGADINETIDNYIGYSPNVDAIGELKIITGDATAEYGNANGGQIVMVTKSGTNHFHGNAFGFLENQNLNANSWGNKHTTGTVAPVNPFNRTIFGGTLGGPVKRDKLFFFFDYQGARQNTNESTFYTVPTAAMRTGLVPIQQANGTYVQEQFNITNPAAQFFLSHPEIYPEETIPGNNTNGGLTPNRNYVGSEKTFVDNNQGDIKIDWQVRQSDLISGRFTIGRETDGNSSVSIPTEIPGNNSNPYTGFIVNWTHTFSPNVVSEARAGFGRSRYIGFPVDVAGNFGLTGNQKLGIPGIQGFPGFSAMTFTGGTALTTIGSAGVASDSIANTFTYGDNVSWQFGKHTIKFGGQALRYQQNRYYSGNDGALGQFTYNGTFTGDSFSDFLTDQANFYGQGESVATRWGQRQWRDALFFQDDWKVMPNLTVNLGLRWEYDQPIYEVNDKQVNINIFTGAVSFAGQNGASRSLYNSYWGGFMPRLGFAFSPERFHDRFVVRGGYAITNFMEGTGANLRLPLNLPFFVDSSANATTVGFKAENGFPQPANLGDYTGQNVRAWQPNLKPAFIQQFNLTTETQFGNDLSLVVAYLGQVGNHLVDPREGNQAPCSLVALPTQPTPCVLPFSTYPNVNGLIVSGISQVSYTESEATMNYNALQTSLRKRTSNGLEFLANYTYSKALSNNLGYYGAGGVSSQSAYWQDAYNGGADYGPAFFDTTHIFSFSGYYDLPFGRGKKFGSNMNRLEDLAAGGWKLGAVSSLHSGFPVTMASPQVYKANQRTDRANHYRQLKITNQSTDHWFGTDASASPCGGGDNGTCAYGSELATGFGTARVGSERAPSFKNFDMAASKRFAITEGSNLEFRADFFNLLNTVSLGPPANDVTTSTWGQITSTNSTERQIQLALKYTF